MALTVKRFSKLYDEAKAKHDRSEDYAIAEIASKKAELPGKVAGALAGIAVGSMAGKRVAKAVEKNGKTVRMINKYLPGVTEAATSKLALIPAMSAGANYGGQLTSLATRKAILREAEDRRLNPEKYAQETMENKIIKRKRR